MATEKTRSQIVEALLALAAERPFSEIGLADIAERAGVSLAMLRDAYDRRMAILADFFSRIDQTVLARTAETTEENPRERLFEVLMRRFDALASYKAGIRSILHAARREPGLALALGRIGVASQTWMLTAADIKATGFRGRMRAQGLAGIWLATMRVWLDEDSADLGKTMASLDRGLRFGERALRFADGAVACAKAPLKAFRDMRRGRESKPGAEGEATA